MSDNNGMQVIVPGSINLTTDMGPQAQKLDEVRRKEERQISGAMFLDKMEQDRIIKLEIPKYEKATKQAELLAGKLTAKAKRIVADLKKGDQAKAVKDALAEFEMSVNLTPEFIRLDLAVEGVTAIVYKWELKESGNNYGGLDGDELTMELPADTADMLAKYWEARKEAKRANDAVVEAQEKLFNRANRAEDARGVHAIKTMTDEEREELKDLYAKVKDGVKVEKLLGAGK